MLFFSLKSSLFLFCFELDYNLQIKSNEDRQNCF